MLSQRLVRFSLGCCRLSCPHFHKSALNTLSSQEINAFSLYGQRRRSLSTGASNPTREKGVLMTHIPQKVILPHTAMLATLDFDRVVFKLRQQGVHIFIYFRLIRRVWIKALLLIGVYFISVPRAWHSSITIRQRVERHDRHDRIGELPTCQVHIETPHHCQLWCM